MSMICHATAPSTICLQEHGCTSQRFSIPYCYVSSLTTGSVYAVINHHHCQCNGCAACWVYTAQHKWQAMLLSWAGTQVGIACQPWLHGTHSAFRDVVSPKWRTFSGSTLINIDAMCTCIDTTDLCTTVYLDNLHVFCISTTSIALM